MRNSFNANFTLINQPIPYLAHLILAHSVQIIVYEIFQACAFQNISQKKNPLATLMTNKASSNIYPAVIARHSILKPKQSTKLMQRMMRPIQSRSIGR